MRSILLALLLASLPSLAWAQMYRCTQADGRVAFQDRPCSAGASGEQIEVRPPALLGDPAEAQRASAAAAQRREFAEQQRLLEELEASRQERKEAPKRRYACERARYNLTALQRQRPVYSRDEAGNKQYLSDAERETEMAAVQRSIRQNCD